MGINKTDFYYIDCKGFSGESTDFIYKRVPIYYSGNENKDNRSNLREGILMADKQGKSCFFSYKDTWMGHPVRIEFT